MLRFDGRVAIVTGAGGGLGRAHAIALAERGANVVVNDLGCAVDGSGTDASLADAVVSEIESAGGTAVADGGDVGDVAAANALVERAMAEFGRLDVVVSNAGIYNVRAFPETDAGDFLGHLHADPLGSFNVCRAAWPHLTASGQGRVVLTATTGFLGSPKAIGYGSGKGGGVVSLGRSLSQIGDDVGIKVNTITPFAYSRMAEANIRLTDEALAERRRLGRPEMVSVAVVVLAHESCPTSGELYAAGGGRVARFFIAGTPGYGHEELTPEDLLEHWDEVGDERDFTVYTGPSGEFADRWYANLADPN